MEGKPTIFRALGLLSLKLGLHEPSTFGEIFLLYTVVRGEPGSYTRVDRREK